MNPTVGTVLWYYSAPGAVPLPFHVSQVNSATNVNGMVISAGGSPFGVSSIPFVQSPAPLPTSGAYTTWAIPAVPVAPVSPAVPVAPVSPAVPVAPVSPAVPVAPAAPTNPHPVHIPLHDINNLLHRI